MSACERFGPHRGEVDPSHDTPAVRDALTRLSDLPTVLALGDSTKTIQLHLPGQSTPFFLTRFSAQSFPGKKSPARNAFECGQHLLKHGVSTPRPVAWLEPAEKSAAPQHFLLTETLPGSQSLRGALLYHYYEKPLCSELMSLLQTAANVVRAMHDAGLEHRDLCNPNIRVRRDKDKGWGEAWITGLYQARIHDALSDEIRGRDNARITLPSDFLRVFLEMQTEPQEMPDSFQQALHRTRSRLHRAQRLKRWTSPKQTTLQEARRYPEEKDIWIWDDRSMQAIPALCSRDKRKYYSPADLLHMGASLCRWGPAIRSAFKDLQASAWREPVELTGRLGLSLNLEPGRFEKERRWLDDLGRLPLMVRLYHHASNSRRRYAMDAIRKLKAEGHRVTVALVQDRNAVLYPRKWREFVDTAGGSLSGFVEGFEVCHAINRVKWGIWNFHEHVSLLQAFERWSDRYPQIPLMGPAGIDFEYPRVLPCLSKIPDGQQWSAFSHHLYVDRRGAPENEQSGYDTVDKLALARAIARVHPDCRERVIVSEVNWPLAGTGVWSPVGSPYQSPGVRHNDPSVDEETYAEYMRRYILMALCSGMADRVYWWNLAAHGFGLIDDRDPSGWRPRPAYHQFRELISQFQGATYRARRDEGTAVRLELTDHQETPFTLGWNPESPRPAHAPEA